MCANIEGEICTHTSNRTTVPGEYEREREGEIERERKREKEVLLISITNII
jgi:hypothetical protein